MCFNVMLKRFVNGRRLSDFCNDTIILGGRTDFALALSSAEAMRRKVLLIGVMKICSNDLISCAMMLTFIAVRSISRKCIHNALGDYMHMV